MVCVNTGQIINIIMVISVRHAPSSQPGDNIHKHSTGNPEGCVIQYKHFLHFNFFIRILCETMK